MAAHAKLVEDFIVSEKTVQLVLDDARGVSELGLRSIDARPWGPSLRCFAPKPKFEKFYSEVVQSAPPFVVSGSGDFHHLSALFLRKLSRPVTVISFDNHPDWDIRPPYWACGGWVTRALELPNVRSVSVWGCGNFELRWPHMLFANRRAIREGRLSVHAWAERQPASVRRRFDCMTRENWRERFERYADSLAGTEVYVTVDLDALSADEAITNWESGLFSAADVTWAIRRLRESATVVAGDICGAWSTPIYARWRQKFAAEWDRPRIEELDPAKAIDINRKSIGLIFPALTGHDSRRF